MDTTRTTAPHRSAGGGLYRLKGAATRALDGVIRAAVTRRVRADTITWAGMAAASLVAAAVVAGAMTSPLWWLAIGPLVALRLGLAVVDGEVARRSLTQRSAGAVLGELTDRGGDVVLAAALAAIAPVPSALAAVGMLAADDVAAIGWAVTGHRTFPGVGGKPDRSILVAVGLALSVALPALALTTAWLLCGLVWTGGALRVRAVWRVAVAADVGPELVADELRLSGPVTAEVAS